MRKSAVHKNPVTDCCNIDTCAAKRQNCSVYMCPYSYISVQIYVPTTESCEMRRQVWIPAEPGVTLPSHRPPPATRSRDRMRSAMERASRGWIYVWKDAVLDRLSGGGPLHSNNGRTHCLFLTCTCHKYSGNNGQSSTNTVTHKHIWITHTPHLTRLWAYLSPETTNLTITIASLHCS